MPDVPNYIIVPLAFLAMAFACWLTWKDRNSN